MERKREGERSERWRGRERERGVRGWRGRESERGVRGGDEERGRGE